VKVKPSKEIWEYYRGEVTTLTVVSSIADRMGGYYISYSANALLKDLTLLTEKGGVNKIARQLVSHYLHEKFHRGIEVDIIIPPLEAK